MVAVPAFTAFTTPVLLTVATAVLLELHVTFLLVVLDGSTVAESVPLPPVFNAKAVVFNVTPVTAFGSVTETVFVLVVLVIGSFMVNVELPTPTPVIVPALALIVVTP